MRNSPEKKTSINHQITVNCPIDCCQVQTAYAYDVENYLDPNNLRFYLELNLTH